jgi:hypothetical protein
MFIFEYILCSSQALVHSQRRPNHRRRSAHARFAHRNPRLRFLRTPLIDIVNPKWKSLTLWRHTAGFCLIHLSPHHGPQHPPTEGPSRERVTSLARQAAGYARMHISARPFLLFSVALLIFGSEFCVAIFGHAGLQFSPVRDLWADTRLFVRVVKSLTCLLLDVELGHDPMVAILHETAPERGADPLEAAFPTYIISMHGRACHTVGPPVWTSLVSSGAAHPCGVYARTGWFPYSCSRTHGGARRGCRKPLCMAQSRAGIPPSRRRVLSSGAEAYHGACSAWGGFGY